ncbi:MAG: GGDEF domain-containing protein, partial [Pseudomonadota bacterium]
MKRISESAYWIYSVATIGSLILAALAFMHSRSGAGPEPEYFGVLQSDLALMLMGATLLFGLVFTLPSIRESQTVQKQLTDRAAKLEVAVVTDPLTGLYNRRYFEDAFDEYLKEFNRIDAPLALLTLDLDHFKSVNDTYGHDAGDVVLKQLALRLRKLTREHDIVARTGGEEFCIVAPFPKSEQIRPFAERVCRMVGEMRIDVGAVVLRPTVSIGVASTLDGVTTKKDLIKLSDERLYQAKETGRNK